MRKVAFTTLLLAITTIASGCEQPTPQKAERFMHKVKPFLKQQNYVKSPHSACGDDEGQLECTFIMIPPSGTTLRVEVECNPISCWLD